MTLRRVGLLSILFFIGGMVVAQKPTQKISLQVENISIKELIKQIESKTSYTLVYRDLLVDVNKNITINEVNKPLKDVLNTALLPKGLQAIFNNNTIIITKIETEIHTKNNTKIVSGLVLDEVGKPIAGASVVIIGTTVGVATDFDGRFTIEAATNAKLRVSFIGYDAKEELINTSVDFKIILEPNPHELNELIITAQAFGLRTAINQQLNAYSIKNVVSTERIRQNPDANAAEAIGRLPGITAIRSGGEANGLIIRGMQGYNNVTVNGLNVPISLTSISQYAFQNVEVFKSLTPDMDASSPAGSVNLKLGTAPDKNSTTAMFQGGYNDLNQKFENYKLNVGLNRRFFAKKLGFSLNLSSESTDRSTEQLFANITVGDQSIVKGEELKLQTQSVVLRDVSKVVKRNSATLVSDYRFSSNASIEWANIITYSPGGMLNIDHTFSAEGNSNYYITNNLGDNNLTYSSILTAKHLLGKINVDYAGAFGYLGKDENQRNISIFADQIYPNVLTSEQKMTLTNKEFIDLASTDNNQKTMNYYGLTSSAEAQPNANIAKSKINDKNIDARINMVLPYRIGNIIRGNLKWGGRFNFQKYKKENYSVNYSSFYFPAILRGNKLIYKDDGTTWNDDINIPANYIDNEGRIMGSYLLDPSSFNNNFLGAGYPYGWSPNMENVNGVLDWWYNLTRYADAKGEDYWRPIFGELGHLKKVNYNATAKENKDFSMHHQAAYIMTQMAIGKQLTLVPGIRYENYYYNMNAWYIHQEVTSYFGVTGEPVNGAHYDDYLLPMFQLKYEPVKWLQGLFSYTQSVKRPTIEQLMPYIYENKLLLTYTTGNPNLKPELWTNYDLGVALHGKKVGLLSMTLFYKNVKDKIEIMQWTKMSTDLTRIVGTFQPSQRVEVTEIKNRPYEGVAKGIEIEWQTSFWYLPKPFKFFTLNFNYSYTNNKTTYVYSALRDSLIGYGRGNRPIYEVYKYDTIVTGPMTNQPSHLFNASIGFSYKKFETWLSYQYIGEVFLGQQVIRAIEPYKTAFSRLDIQVKYGLPIKGLDLLFNIANITNTEERRYLRGDSRPTQIERYGWTSDVGFRYSF